MDNIAVQHRLLGAEDIEFDRNCANEQTSFLTPFGVAKPLSKLNAGHLPLDRASFVRLGQTVKTVSEALNYLKGEIEKITVESGSGLSEDKIVEDLTDADCATKIAQERTGTGGILNGHTLTFQLAPDQGNEVTFVQPLVIEGFNGGEVVLDLNGNNVSYTPSSGVFLTLQDCGASVTVKNGTINFNAVSQGVLVDRCPSVKFKDIAFASLKADACYAVYAPGCDVQFDSCTFTPQVGQTRELYLGGTKDENDDWDKAGGAWIAFQDSLAAFGASLNDYFTKINNNEARLDCRADYVVSHGTQAVEQGTGNTINISWIEYKSGLLIQWGKTSRRTYRQCWNSTSGATGTGYYENVTYIDFKDKDSGGNFQNGRRFADNSYHLQVQVNTNQLTTTLNPDGSIATVYSHVNDHLYAPWVDFNRNASRGDRAVVFWQRNKGTPQTSTTSNDSVNMELCFMAIGQIDPQDATKVTDPSDD